MNIWKKILNVLNSITKKDIIYTLIIVLLIGCLSSAVKQCSDTRFEYKNNIAALNDTIRYYQDKNGNLVATKLAFESDINTLKLLNEDLYNQIQLDLFQCLLQLYHSYKKHSLQVYGIRC